MRIRPPSIGGAFEDMPPHVAARGRLVALSRLDALREAVGHPLPPTLSGLGAIGERFAEP